MKGIKMLFSLFFLIFCWASCLEASSEEISLKAITYPAELELKSKFYLIKDEVMQQVISFYGTTKGVKEAKLVLDLPKGTELLYAFHAPTGSGRPTYELKEPIKFVSFKRKDGLYTRCAIVLREDLLKQGVPKNFPSQWKKLNLFLYFKSTHASGKGKLFYHTETDGKSGDEKELECIFLSPLGKVNISRKIKFYAICGGDLSCPNKDVWEGLYSLCNKIGIKGCYQHFPANVSKELAKRGWLVLADVGYGWAWWWVYSPSEVIKPGIKPEEILATLRSGEKTKDPKILCLTYLIENGDKGKPFFNILKKRVKERVSVPGIGGIFDDFEQEWHRAQSPLNSCFCPRCRKAFLEYFGINIETLSPEEILSKYRNQWFQFRVWQNSQMIRILAEVIKEVNPNLEFIVCSAPITWGRLPHQGYDIRTHDQYLDEHWPMAYETNMSLMYIVEATVKALKKPVVPILMTCSAMEEPNHAFHPDEVERNILASVTSGAKGIAFFTGTTTLDGAYIKAIARAQEKIAFLEDFFADGIRDDTIARIEVKEWNGIKYRVHQLGQSLLLSLFNYSPKEEAFLKIGLPQIEKGSFFMYDPTEKNHYVNSEGEDFWKSKELKEGFVFELDKEEVRFLILSPRKPKGDYKKVRIGSSGWEKKYEGYLAKRKSKINKYLIASHPKEIHLNGKDDFVKIKCKGLEKKDEFTISLWVYMDDRGIDQMGYRNPMVSWENQEGSVSRFTITNTGRLSFATSRFAEGEVTSHSDKILSPGKWYYLTIAFNKGLARLFINGEQPPDGINCIKSKLFPRVEEIFVGKYGNRFFKGKIKEVRIYNKALYEEEIKSIFGNG